MREKMHAKKHEEKKNKQRKKDSPYFQIKRYSSKREIHDSKSTKNV
jgi:hypothetical protein